MMNKNKRFNKKQAVRFVLIPGKDQNGNATTMFKPVETRNKLSLKQKSKIITEISDYQIQIDGKLVNQSDLPAFVLEQIKGRADLVFNQKNPDLEFKQQQEYQEQMIQMMEEDGQEWDDQEGQEIPQQQFMNAQSLSINTKKQKQIKQKSQEEQLQQVDVDGHKYKISKNQLKMLQEVLPQNYQNFKIEGVQFVKYDEDGNRIDQKQSYQKYIAEPKERRGIIDSYQYIPEKPVDIVDNDLEGQVLKGDVKELDDALNYEGELDAYEELEDDFFAQLVSGEKKAKDNNTKTIKDKQLQKQMFKKKVNNQIAVSYVTNKQNIKVKQQKLQTKQPKIQSKLDELDGDDQQYEDYQDQDYQDDDDYDQQEITDQMLDKALQQFNKIGNKNQKNQDQVDYQRIPGTGVPLGTRGTQLIKFIESRQQCIGKDGQLDWRTLTKKQKKQYMKNKKIRSIFEEVREKQIQQKLKGKENVKAQQLHLKKYIEHIPYNQDHVMQEAIQRDLKQVVNIQSAIDNQQDFQTESSEDDIVSYRAKTSIICSNLATVEETGQRKKKKRIQKQLQDQKQIINQLHKVKVIPQRRNRNQTSEERKQRKLKLKELKKQRKQQRKQFNQKFDEERKNVIKRQNNTTTNILHKISYVKMV